MHKCLWTSKHGQSIMLVTLYQVRSFTLKSKGFTLSRVIKEYQVISNRLKNIPSLWKYAFLFQVTMKKNLTNKLPAKAGKDYSRAHSKDAKNIIKLVMGWVGILTQIISKLEDFIASIALKSSLRKYTRSSMSTNIQERDLTSVVMRGAKWCLDRNQASLDTSKSTMSMLRSVLVMTVTLTVTADACRSHQRVRTPT